MSKKGPEGLVSFIFANPKIFFIGIPLARPKTVAAIVLGTGLIGSTIVHDVIQQFKLGGKVKQALIQSAGGKPINIEFDGTQRKVTLTNVDANINQVTKYTSNQKPQTTETGSCNVTTEVEGPIKTYGFRVGDQKVKVTIPLRVGPCK